MSNGAGTIYLGFISAVVIRIFGLRYFLKRRYRNDDRFVIYRGYTSSEGETQATRHEAKGA